MWTQIPATAPYIYEEKVVSPNGGGEGSLSVKQLKRDGSQFALIGYVHAGIDIAPIVYVRGSLDDCRKGYRTAKRSMSELYGIKE